VTFRDELLQLRGLRSAQDVEQLVSLTARTGFFSEEEVAITRELAEAALRDGPASSGYHHVLCEQCSSDRAQPGKLLGYTCFGPIPATLDSWDLYWIAVAPEAQRRGIGQRLLAHSEQLARSNGAGRIYIDTASRPQYVPTHQFYLRSGYVEAAKLVDFYSPGDRKLIFVKVL
jgi:GNAT superfamily N-acetyltransferase